MTISRGQENLNKTRVGIIFHLRVYQRSIKFFALHNYVDGLYNNADDITSENSEYVRLLL